MKRFPIVLTVVALGAAGFAAASIASGGRFAQMLTGTGDTVTTPTVTVATTATTTETTTTEPTTTGEEGGRRVVMCHHTGSKKHPFHTITVDQHAVQAHLRHHDTLGACPAVAPTQSTTATQHGNGGKGKGDGRHGKSAASPTTTTATTTTTSGDSSGHGNSGGNGNGHGHGKP